VSDSSAIASRRCSDLVELESLADRYGFGVGTGKVDELFTKPDAIRRAVRDGTLTLP
jgi:hypothetical protein